MKWASTFAERLGAAIRVAGFTRRDVAISIGISERQVEYYVAGDSFPSVPALRNAALSTRHSVDSLLGLEQCEGCGGTFEEEQIERVVRDDGRVERVCRSPECRG